MKRYGRTTVLSSVGKSLSSPFDAQLLHPLIFVNICVCEVSGRDSSSLRLLRRGPPSSMSRSSERLASRTGRSCVGFSCKDSSKHLQLLRSAKLVVRPSPTSSLNRRHSFPLKEGFEPSKYASADDLVNAASSAMASAS